MQIEASQIFCKDHGVKMNGAASVVVLACCLAFAILIFQPGGKIDATPSPIAIFWETCQDAVLPCDAAVALLSSSSNNPLSEQLYEDVGQMHRFQGCHMRPCPQQRFHLVKQGSVIRSAPLIRRPGLEHHRVAALALQIQDSSMSDGPVGWRKRGSFHKNSHRQVGLHVPLGSQVAPISQVVHKLKQLKLSAVV